MLMYILIIGNFTSRIYDRSTGRQSGISLSLHKLECSINKLECSINSQSYAMHRNINVSTTLWAERRQNYPACHKNQISVLQLVESICSCHCFNVLASISEQIKKYFESIVTITFFINVTSVFSKTKGWVKKETQLNYLGKDKKHP
jgi:hypothetical protein